jgi:hypothetical protein
MIKYYQRMLLESLTSIKLDYLKLVIIKHILMVLVV